MTQKNFVLCTNPDSVAISFTAITNENARNAFLVPLSTLLLWDMHITFSSKHFQMVHRLYSLAKPQFKWRFIDDSSWTSPVQNVCCSVHSLCPKFDRQMLRVNH